MSDNCSDKKKRDEYNFYFNLSIENKKNFNVFSTLGISALALNISVAITEGKGMQTQDWMREFSTTYVFFIIAQKEEKTNHQKM